MQQQDLLNNDLTINSTSQANLLVTAGWAKFLAIIGFVFCALMVLSGITIMTVTPSYNAYGNTGQFIQYLGAIYIVLAIVLFFPCLYLLKFSNKMQDAIRASNQESLDIAFINLKSLYKFYGIFTIVIMVLTVLAFLGGMSAMMMR